MEILTAGVNRTLKEQGKDFTVSVDEVQFFADIPNRKESPHGALFTPAVLRLLYRDLLDSMK
jgi:hypothetical protein